MDAEYVMHLMQLLENVHGEDRLEELTVDSSSIVFFKKDVQPHQYQKKVKVKGVQVSSLLKFDALDSLRL